MANPSRSFTQDTHLEPHGVPKTFAAVPLAISPTLAISGSFFSKWYSKSPTSPRVIVAAYGDRAGDLYVQETNVVDPNGNPPTELAKKQWTTAMVTGTLNGSTRFTCELDARLIYPWFRIVFINGGTAQTLLELFAVMSSQ